MSAIDTTSTLNAMLNSSSSPIQPHGNANNVSSVNNGVLSVYGQGASSPIQTTTLVSTKMRKSLVSFTAVFNGISGFPAEVGMYTSSPIVELEERQWSLRIYPGGKDATSAGYISCFVSYESRGKTRASYRLTLCNQMGWKNHSVSSDSVKNFYNTQDPGDCSCWGETKFIAKNDLKHAASGHCVEDTIAITVDLTIYGDLEQNILSAHVKSGSLLEKGRSLQDDLSRM